MPVYEFYCPDCHTIYGFFTSSPEDRRQPACPKCGRPDLERKPSRFATPKGLGETGIEDDPFAELSDERLAGAMETLMMESAHMDDGDPRAIGHMMRRFGELTGLGLGDRLQGLVERMEAGEDPGALEAEMDAELGDSPDGGMEGFFELRKALKRRRIPTTDDTLYFL